MTRRDYILIAEGLGDALALIRATYPEDQKDRYLALAGFWRGATLLAGKLASTNPRFEMDVFIANVQRFAEGANDNVPKK